MIERTRDGAKDREAMSLRDRMVRGIRAAWADAPGLGVEAEIAQLLRRRLEDDARLARGLVPLSRPAPEAIDPTQIREDVLTLCGCCDGTGYQR